jgi:hypothetical protein
MICGESRLQEVNNRNNFQREPNGPSEMFIIKFVTKMVIPDRTLRLTLSGNMSMGLGNSFSMNKAFPA